MSSILINTSVFFEVIVFDELHRHDATSPVLLYRCFTAALKIKEKFLSLILKSVIMMLLICFFFLLLPLTSFLLLLSLVLRHRRHRYRRHSRSSSGFSTKQLKRLPRLRFSQETSITHPESDSCVICLDEFRQGQWCRDLVGCGHLFHRKCLDSWLIKATSCPICRTKVFLENEDGCIPDSCSRRTEFQGLLAL